MEIVIFKRKSVFLGFEMSGHAFYGNPGEDILCASLSTLGINTSNSLEKICGLDEKKQNQEYADGFLKILIDEKDIEGEIFRDSQTIFKVFEIGIISLKEQYNKYIEIYYREV